MNAGIAFDLLSLSGLSHQERDFTAETRRALSRKLLIKGYSDLCELSASAVK
jgi:hypothetical protein